MYIFQKLNFKKIKKYIYIGFYFVALILNNVMAQKKSKTDSRFKRKMYFKVNQLNLHPLYQPCRDRKKFGCARGGAHGGLCVPLLILATCRRSASDSFY